MRIKCFFALLALLVAAKVSADEPRKATAVLPATGRFETALSLSGFPASQLNAIAHGIHLIDPPVEDRELWDLYEGHFSKLRSTGTFLLDLNWNVTRFVDIGASLGYNHFWGTHTKKGVATAEAFYVLPEVRYTLVRRPVFHLYLKGNAGAGWYDGFDRLSHPIQFEYQGAIGIAFGKRFFGKLEQGIGSLYFGFNAGFGYRF